MSLFDTHEPVAGGQDPYPDAIKFKFLAPGDIVEGTVVDLSTRLSGDFGEYRLATFESEDGNTHWKVLLGSVALDKFERGGGVKGAKAAIRFEGLKPTKKNPNKSYKDFSVVVVPPANGQVSNGGVPATRPDANATPF